MIGIFAHQLKKFLLTEFGRELLCVDHCEICTQSVLLFRYD